MLRLGPFGANGELEFVGRLIVHRCELAAPIARNMVISTLTSGYFGRSFANFGQRTEWIAWSPAVIRMVPAGFSRSSLSPSSSASISSNRGPTVLSRRSPAAVGATLRVVRVKSRTPRRASSSRMVWLNADCDMPSFAAAFVKLRSRPTATRRGGHPGFHDAFIEPAHKSAANHSS